MAYADLEGRLLDAYTLSANKDTDALDVRHADRGAIVLVWSAAAATDAVVKLQESMDKTTWFDISGATQTLSAASGSKKFSLASVELPYVRAVLTKNTETAAVVTLKHFFKGR